MFTRRDSTPILIEYTVSPLLAASQIVGMVVAFRDITTRQRTTDERALVLAQINAALAFRTRFLAITAHELKTPLTLIDGYAQQLRRRALYRLPASSVVESRGLRGLKSRLPYPSLSGGTRVEIGLNA